MKYTIENQSDLEVVVIEANGVASTRAAGSMVFAAGLELKHAGFKRCLFDLVDTEAHPDQTMTEMFIFADVFKSAGFDRSVRVAVLYVSGEKYHLHLGKAATLKGLNLRHFTDRDEALRWLRQ